MSEHHAPQHPGDFTITPARPASDSAAAATTARERLLADVANRFTYHPPKGDQLQRHAALRHQARDLAEAIAVDTPPSREQALAAKAAIARHE